MGYVVVSVTEDIFLQNKHFTFDIYCRTCNEVFWHCWSEDLAVKKASWERSKAEEIKPTDGTVLLPPFATLTFYTEESILRRNTLFIFSFCITLPLTSPPLCGLMCTFSPSFSSSSSTISPPLFPFLCFSLSLGRQLHAETLWITELQDTVSKNCSIFPQSIFLKRWAGQAAWYDAAILVLEFVLGAVCFAKWIRSWCIIDVIWFFLS